MRGIRNLYCIKNSQKVQVEETHTNNYTYFRFENKEKIINNKI